MILIDWMTGLTNVKLVPMTCSRQQKLRVCMYKYRTEVDSLVNSVTAVPAGQQKWVKARHSQR